MALDSYEEHALFQIIPAVAILIFIMIFLLITIKKKYNEVMDGVVKMTIGEFFLIRFGEVYPEINEDEVDYDSLSKSRKKTCLLFMLYHIFVVILAGSALCLAGIVFWYTLVEQETIGTCVEDADCFTFLRNDLKSAFNAKRVENCSDFTLENNSTIICYRAGFYLLEAFGYSGGLLYMLNSITQILLPFLILFSGDNYRWRFFIGSLFVLANFCILAVYLALSFVLPSSSLRIVSGKGIFTLFLIFLSLFMMAGIVVTYPVGGYHIKKKQKDQEKENLKPLINN